jgi:uncharacterized protein
MQAERPPALAMTDMDGASFPFREFVLKVHSRCDLACDYCYLYAMADHSWRTQPMRMSSSVVAQAATRIAEHAREHHLAEITVVLHGGEPLLAGPDLITEIVSVVRDAAGSDITVHFHAQTNGVRLDEAYLALFSRLGIGVAVSLDGDQAAQDRHRRFADGRGSHRAVSAGLALLTGSRYRHLFNGLLSVVDLSNDPLETYAALLAFDPPQIDFLLPHGTWDDPPPMRTADQARTPYADWLIPVFDVWYREPVTQVRLFADIVRSLLGVRSGTESVGLTPTAFVVIETDGSIEQVDSLKATHHGASRTGLHIMRDSLDEALLLPEIAVRQMGLKGLCHECQNCRIRLVCGGGLYAHRYRSSSGFANPSVYCADLMRLIDHISHVVKADINSRFTGCLGAQNGH